MSARIFILDLERERCGQCGARWHVSPTTGDLKQTLEIIDSKDAIVVRELSQEEIDAIMESEKAGGR